LKKKDRLGELRELSLDFKIEPTVLEVPIDSMLGRMGVDIFDGHSDKRICQSSLDFYRGKYRHVVDVKDAVVFFVALYAGNICGISAALIKSRPDDSCTMHNSITVVHKDFRRHGIASTLMKNKLDKIRSSFRGTMLTKVAKDNVGSIKACKNAGMREVGSGNDKKSDGSTFEYVVLSA